MKPLYHLDFVTPQDARDYEVISYVLITSNEAEQFFGIGGLTPILEAATSNATSTTIIPSLPTTVGSIVQTLLNTMGKSNGVFGIDPAKTSGIFNRAAGNEIVKAGIIEETTMNAFYEVGTIRTKPYKNITDEEYLFAKAEQATQGVTSYSELKYNGYEPDTHFVSAGFRTLKLAALVTPAFDTKITVTLESETSFGQFVEEPNKITINCKAGQNPAAKLVDARDYPRLLKVKSATIGLADTPFKLEMYGVR